ncbi:MAG: hypothetical protein SGARI_000409, partial [Bacillariaceae sp.]
MGGKKTKKSNKKHRLRGSRGLRRSEGNSGNLNNNNCDLFVPLPKSSGSSIEWQLILKEVTSRLISLKYTHMALTHTIYGRPKAGETDKANTAIPDSLIDTLLQGTGSDSAPNNSSSKKKRKRSSDTDEQEASTTSTSKSPNNQSNSSNNSDTIHILRRLHVVLENVSDVFCYFNLKKSEYQQLFLGYDLISVSPTNDAVFAAICKQLSSQNNSNKAIFDILTIDYYSSGRFKLQYRINSGHIQTLLSSNIALEYPMAPSVLNLKSRKALIHASREVQMASVGKERKLPILLSSGDRTRRLEGSGSMAIDDSTENDDDAGAMAIHSSGDLQNLCCTIMQFHAEVSAKSMRSMAQQVIQRGNARKLGKMAAVSIIESVDFMDSTTALDDASENDNSESSSDSNSDIMMLDSSHGGGGLPNDEKAAEEQGDENIGDGGDGFIALFDTNDDDDNEVAAASNQQEEDSSRRSNALTMSSVSNQDQPAAAATMFLTDEPRYSSAALCISLKINGGDEDDDDCVPLYFRPVYTHQCQCVGMEEVFSGFRPFSHVLTEALAEVSSKKKKPSTNAATSSLLLHKSHALHKPSDKGMEVRVTLSPSCEICFVSFHQDVGIGGRSAADYGDSLQKALPPIVSTGESRRDGPAARYDYLAEPVGRVLQRYTVPRNNNSSNNSNRNAPQMNFAISLADGQHKHVAAYHKMVQPLALFFIENADNVDVTNSDNGYWKILYIFRKHSSSNKAIDGRYSLVGYFTLFHFIALFHKPKPG